MRAGVLPVQAIQHLSNDSTLTPAEATALREAVEAGRPLTSGLTALPQEEIALLEAGEASGNLDRLLDKLASIHEAERSMWRQLVRRMWWPFLTAIAALFLIPTGLAGLSGTLTPTRWMLMMTGIAVALFVAWRVGRSMWSDPTSRHRLRRWLDKVPGFGTAARHRRRARFCRALEAAYESGIPIAQAMGYADKTLDQGSAGSSVSVVEQGGTMATALASTGVLSAPIIARLTTAEEAGDLSNALRSIATDESERGDMALEQGLSVLGLVLMGILGLCIAWYAITIFTRITTI